MRVKSPAPALVGRDRETRELARHLAAAQAGRAQAVLIRGPVGIGKTRLLDSLASPDVAVVRATCRESTADRQYGIAQQLLLALGISLPPQPVRTHRPQAGRPGHGATSRQPGTRSVDRGATRANLGRSADPDTLLTLSRITSQLLDHAPLVIVVDDAQWCDEGSARWLDLLLSHDMRRPLFVLLAQSGEHRTQASCVFDAVVAEGRCTPLDLGPLPPSAIAELVADVFQEQGTASFNRRCAEFSGGNPLLLMRLLDVLRVSGGRPDDDGKDQLPALGHRFPGPDLLTDLLQWPQHLSQVARAVALLGSTDAELVGILAQLPHRLVCSSIQELRDRGVLTGFDATFAAQTFQDALLAEMPDPAMIRLRARAARLLDDAAYPVARIAEQLLHLPRLDESWMIDVLRDAAAEADGTSAARYLSRLWQEDPSIPSVRLELAHSLLNSDPVLALSHLEHALAQSTDSTTRARAAAHCGWAAVVLDRCADAWHTVDNALAEFDAVTQGNAGPATRELRATLLATLGAAGMAHVELLPATWDRLMAPGVDAGRPLDRDAAAGDGVVPADGIGGPTNWAAASVDDLRLVAVRGLLVALRGADLGLARRYAHRVLRANRVVDDWAVIPTARLLMLLDELPQALELLERALPAARSRNDTWVEYLIQCDRAAVLLETGCLDEAVPTAKAALRVADRCGWHPDTSLPRLVLISALLLRGHVHEAQDLMAGLDPDLLLASVWTAPGYLRALARLQRICGDAAAALRTLVGCGEVLARAGVGNDALTPWWADAIHILVALDRAQEAGDLAEHGTALGQRWPTRRGRGLGLLAASTVATGPDRLKLATAAAEALTDACAPCYEVGARLQLSRVLLETGDRVGARKQLREVSVLCARQGLTALHQRTEQLLVSAGGRTPPSGPRLADLLTGSELRVAELAARGETNREIAESLFVSTRTVEFHLTNVYRKAGSGNRQKLSLLLGLGQVDLGKQIGELTG